MLALNIPFFAPAEQFFAAAERLAAQVAMSPPAEGFDAVLLPGEPELRMRERRIAEGIPVAQRTWDELRALANELGISLEA
jgi:LDH2 family malate/lactate/ureidoglycolate dehydrogenase